MYQGVRPSLPEQCQPTLKNLCKSCWETTPSKRPSFEKILEALSKLEASIKGKRASQLQPPAGSEPRKDPLKADKERRPHRSAAQCAPANRFGACVRACACFVHPPARARRPSLSLVGHESIAMDRAAWAAKPKEQDAIADGLAVGEAADDHGGDAATDAPKGEQAEGSAQRRESVKGALGKEGNRQARKRRRARQACWLTWHARALARERYGMCAPVRAPIHQRGYPRRGRSRGGSSRQIRLLARPSSPTRFCPRAARLLG